MADDNSSNDGRSFIFRGGRPYGPDRRRLDEAFPVISLTEGRIILHSQLEEVLGMKRTASRYYALVNSWLSHKRGENGLVIRWESKVGLKVLDPAGVLDFAERRTRQKVKQTIKAVKTFAWVDRARLDGTGQLRLDHQLRIVGAMKDGLEHAKKQLAIELAPVKSLPQRKI